VSQATITKIWSVSVLALLYFSINAWSVAQQAQLSLPGNPLKDGKISPYGVTLIAIRSVTPCWYSWQF